MSNGTWNSSGPAPAGAPTGPDGGTDEQGGHDHHRPGPGRTMAVIVPNSAPMSIALAAEVEHARSESEGEGEGHSTIGIMRLNVLRRPLPVNPPVSISPKARAGHLR